MKRLIAAGIALSLSSGAAFSEGNGVVRYSFDGEYDDATFALESAIIDQGLVIDSVSHVGEMLNRTKADVGGSTDLFEAADVFQFCSASLSRKVMAADPMNIAHCPYRIFVAQTGSDVTIGYVSMPEGPMQEVQQLLEAIVQSAIE